MPDTRGFFDLTATGLSRRTALKGLAAGASLMAAPGFVRYAQAQSSAPIRIGFQSHRTGIGATYAHWYEKTTAAAIKAINDAGGINGCKVDYTIADDKADPAVAGPDGRNCRSAAICLNTRNSLRGLRIRRDICE